MMHIAAVVGKKAHLRAENEEIKFITPLSYTWMKASVSQLVENSGILKKIHSKGLGLHFKTLLSLTMHN